MKGFTLNYKDGTVQLQSTLKIKAKEGNKNEKIICIINSINIST